MFRTVRLSIIRSLFTVHSAMVYVIQVCRQLLSRSICSCPKSDEMSETCRVSWQNKFVKLVDLVDFIINTQTLFGTEQGLTSFESYMYLCNKTN